MRIVVIGFVLLLGITVRSQDNRFLPKNGVFDQQLEQTGYYVGFDYETKLPEWVAYELTAEELLDPVKRTNSFKLNPVVGDEYENATSSYSGSGYDRGHLAPAADLCWSTKSMKESFYMTNMAPQLAGFNRGMWKRAETLTREWATLYGKVYVISGSVFKPYTLSMPNGKGVEIPKQFFKIVYREGQMIAFLFDNKKLNGEPRRYVTNVNAIEELTGLDFFSELEDAEEERLEQKSNASSWKF